MFDIGLGEIALLAVVGLLIFGPEKLPKAAADGARFLKQLRTMAAGAQRDLADSAGLDLTEAVDTVKGLAEFHPKRIASSMLTEQPVSKQPVSKQTPAPSTPTFDPDAT